MAGSLENFEILLGVTGGIAAYKAAQLCSTLRQNRAGVTVAMTPNATRFVAPLTFATLSARKVHLDLFQDPQAHDVHHIALTDRADLVVVAPATANILAKLAAGLADDLLSTLLLSAHSPVLFAPAMNERMWNHPATRRNLETLRNDGCHFIEPDTGRLACGTTGPGRMAQPDAILERIRELLADRQPKRLAPPA